MYKTKVKICGLKRLEDIQIVNKYKPDFAGFVFASSKRRVTPEYAKFLINNLDSSILRVGIFVNEDAGNTADIAACCGLNAVQLHGDEDNEYIKKLRDLLYEYNLTQKNDELPGMHNNLKIDDNTLKINNSILKINNNVPEIWKVIRIKNRESCNFLHECHADAYVLDTYSEKAYGGTGNAFDWEIVRGIAADGAKIILAGGLNPQNVQKAIDIVRPFAVDVSSWVETNGCKDEEKIREFIFSIY